MFRVERMRKLTPEEKVISDEWHRAYLREYYLANKEKLKKQMRENYLANREDRIAKAREWEKKNPERKQELQRQSARKNRAKIYEKYRRNFERDKLKLYARWAINVAVYKGRIIPPDACSKCGKECRLHAHHYLGYAKEHRRDVIWLCPKCHAAAHANGT